MRQQSFNGAPTGVRIIDAVFLDSGFPNRIETKHVIGSGSRRGQGTSHKKRSGIGHARQKIPSVAFEIAINSVVKPVVVTKEETTIVQGAGKKSDVVGRTHAIKSAIDAATSDWDKEKLQERLGKLTGSVAVIKVGAATETEL